MRRVTETINQFMERRGREVALRPDAEAAGYDAWASSVRVGSQVSAPRPSDLRILGRQRLAQNQRAYSASRQSSQFGVGAGAPRAAAVSLGDRMYVAPADDIAKLRQEQARFRETEHAISRENQWMAIPALAPAAVVLALEAGAALTASAAVPTVARKVLNFTARDRYLRNGENVTTSAGRRAHRELAERVEQKPGWEYEPRFNGPNGLRKPDVGAPVRDPAQPQKRLLMEYKPNTPSGRRAGERAARRYEQDTGNKARVIYYDPKDYM